MRPSLSLTLSLLCIGLAPERALAQSRPPTWAFGFGAGAFLPQGAFGDHADVAAAYGVSFSYQSPGPWGARFTGEIAEYAHSDTSFALPGIDVTTRTASSLSWMTVGPQLLLGTGSFRGLLHAGVGGAWAGTETSVLDVTAGTGVRNLQKGGMAVDAGAALWWSPLASRAMWFEMGGRYLYTGELEYVPDGGIRREAGALVLTTRRDRMDAVVLRASVVLGLTRHWR